MNILKSTIIKRINATKKVIKIDDNIRLLVSQKKMKYGILMSPVFVRF